MFNLNLNKERKLKKKIPEKFELWKMEMKDAIRDSNGLKKILKTSIPRTDYPLFIPQRLARKIYHDGPFGPLWKQFVPSSFEHTVTEGLEDPIGDYKYSRPGKIIHRYKSRVLFFSNKCVPGDLSLLF